MLRNDNPLKEMLCDPTVVQLPNGTYKLFYKVAQPTTPTGGYLGGPGQPGREAPGLTGRPGYVSARPSGREPSQPKYPTIASNSADRDGPLEFATVLERMDFPGMHWLFAVDDGHPDSVVLSAEQGNDGVDVGHLVGEGTRIFRVGLDGRVRGTVNVGGRMLRHTNPASAQRNQDGYVG